MGLAGQSGLAGLPRPGLASGVDDAGNENRHSGREGRGPDNPAIEVENPEAEGYADGINRHPSKNTPHQSLEHR